MIKIGDRRELLCDDYLVDTDKTTAGTELCRPTKKEAVFVHTAPWEQNDTVYHNIVKCDDGKYRMYYKSHYNDYKPDGCFGLIRRICCIESTDGLHWTRPNLGETPLDGYSNTNIISSLYDYYDNMFVFRDENVKEGDATRYKAIYGEWGTGLFSYGSPDGVHFNWRPDYEKIKKGEMAPPPPGAKADYPKPGDRNRPSSLIASTKETGCYFDTLNTVFYDKECGKYVVYVRGFHIGDDMFPDDPDDPRAVRDIRRMESDDYINFTYPEPLKYNDDFDYQLYANAILPYYRAPHILVGTPTRYVAWPDWNNSFEQLPCPEERGERPRGKSLNDAIFMSSRDGINWQRYSEAIFTSGPQQKRNWVYGDCYPCVGMIETPSDNGADDPELSLYCKEHQEGMPPLLYRYTIRVDGFVCRRAPYSGGMLVTKPFVFDGSELEVNFATSAIGYIKFTIKDKDGNSVSSCPHVGDSISRRVGFDGTLSAFAGKEVVLEAEMHDARLYSFKFNK